MELATSEALRSRVQQLEEELRQLTQREQRADSIPDSGEHESEQERSFDPLIMDAPWGNLLRQFIDSNLIAVTRFDNHGNILEANDAFTALVGYARAELLSGNVRMDTITPGEYKPLDYTGRQHLCASQKARPWEMELIHKDGHRVPVLLALSSIDIGGSDCLCFVVDLTQIKEAERALRQSEARFRLLIDIIPHKVFVSDADGNIGYFNTQWSEHAGSPEGSDRNWINTVHPDDRDKYLNALKNASVTGAACQLEIKHKDASDTYRWSLVRVLPIKDAAGNVVRLLGTCTDIDDAKEAEQGARESEARFRTLADAIPQIVWTAAPDGRLEFFNQRWSEFTGLTYDQSVNDGWQLLIHPDDLKPYLDEWHRALETGDTYEREFRIRKVIGKTGTANLQYYRLLARAVAMRNKDGDITRWFATWTEIETPT